VASRDRHRRSRWRVGFVALLLAGSALVSPVPARQAHTCTPDPNVGVSGRLIVPRSSGLAVVGLPDRAVHPLHIAPSQGVATGVATSRDGSLLAVPRFWRPPDHKVGGQDILLVDPSGGAPVATLDRGQPGEVLGSPVWLPDGSLVYERRVLSGSNEAVQIERSRPGQPGQILAENAYWPGVSPDGALLAMVRFSGTDRLIVRPLDGGPEQVLVDRPQLLSIAFPRFSPDGSWIAFTAASDPGTIPAAGPAPDARPSSRSTSTWAALRDLPYLSSVSSYLGAGSASAHGVPWDVWIVRPDGSELRQLTSFFDDDSSVAWSPDGRWLATFSAEAIHIVSFEDPGQTYCVTNEGGYGAVEWLP
jgi:dipeptidyl aminopeptidase/acylaminoacyl peptidase